MIKNNIVTINITEDQRQRARERDPGRALNHSFTNGAGNLVGALGEVIVHDYYQPSFKFPDKTHYDYDLLHYSGKKIDVKSKKITFNYKPMGDFKVSVSTKGLGINQQCDVYIFTFIHESLQTGYIVGCYQKSKFLEDSYFKKKGELDDIGDVRNPTFRFKADAYHMLLKDLIYVPNNEIQGVNK
jgi:hypothetical protein